MTERTVTNCIDRAKCLTKSRYTERFVHT